MLKTITAGLLIGTFLASPLSLLAADKTVEQDSTKKADKVKPYTLKTCLISDEKLGGDMGDPYVFNYQGREIKMCCKDCKKDFDKDPAKFIKKLNAAEKKAAEKAAEKK